MAKVCVSIAMIERADPCMLQYAEFLRRVRGPHPSRAYFDRQKCRYGLIREVDLMAAKMRRRKVFRVGRHDKIELARIAGMRPNWAEWVVAHVLSAAQSEKWQVESGSKFDEEYDVDELEYDDECDEEYHEYDEEYEEYEEYF